MRFLISLFLISTFLACQNNQADAVSVNGITSNNSTISSNEKSSSDCSDPMWSSSESYPNPKTVVQHNGKRYESKWYANPGQEPGNGDNSPWKLIGFCDGSGIDCSGFTKWSSSKTYAQKGTKVIYDGQVYSNKWYIQKEQPGTADVWEYLGPCGSGGSTPVQTNETEVSDQQNDEIAETTTDTEPSTQEVEKEVVFKPTPNIKGSKYPYGLLPTNLKSGTLESAYAKWESKYVTSSGAPSGAKRVLFDDMSHTVSEGIGYGMLASACMNDKSTFDAIYKYYNAHLDPKGLMHWKINASGNAAGKNAATDADVDVAYALLIAHKNFGDAQYLSEAKKIIGLIKKHMIEAGTYVLKPGDVWGGSNTTNPSYFAPAYFHVFTKVTGDNTWDKVADKSYDILFKCWNTNTGLVPDWCKADGSIPASNVSWAKNGGKTYYYDAARTPWRIAKDYLWYGDSRAIKYCKKVADFVESKGIANMKDGYQLNGSSFSNNRTSTFIGPFATASMAAGSNYQSAVNKGYSQNIATFNNVYFNDSLRLLTLLLQHGMFPKY